jgi:hypothetical protein
LNTICHNKDKLQEFTKLSAIAKPKRYGAGGGEWDRATDASPSESIHPTQERLVHQVIESCMEQPWAEFCSALDKPAFLLPITGFAEL